MTAYRRINRAAMLSPRKHGPANVRDIRRGGLIIRSDQRWVRLAAVGALMAALGLSACGRKGALDPPPAAAVPVQQVVPVAHNGGPVDVLGPDGRPVPAAAPAPPPPPQQQRFILDWILN
jgi:predicted small lipoprotein YifL